MSFLSLFPRRFVLNLDTRPDRLSCFNAATKKHGFDVERLAAHIPSDRGRFCTPGNRGCHESHIHLIERAEKEKWPTIFIFEDDAALRDDFLKKMDAGCDDLEKQDWHLFYPFFYRPHIYRPISRETANLCRVGSTLQTHAYGIHQSAYRRIIEASAASAVPYDQLFYKHLVLRTFVTPYDCAVQKDDFSDLMGRQRDWNWPFDKYVNYAPVLQPFKKADDDVFEVTFALVPYNDQVKLTQRLLDIKRIVNDYPSCKFEVLVADNSDTPLELRDIGVAVRRVYSGPNLMYGGGLNRIAQEARYPNIVYLCTTHGELRDTSFLRDLLVPMTGDVVMTGTVRHSWPESRFSNQRIFIQGGVFAIKTKVLRENPYPAECIHARSDHWLSWKIQSLGLRFANVGSVCSEWATYIKHRSSYKYIHDYIQYKETTDVCSTCEPSL